MEKKRVGKAVINLSMGVTDWGSNSVGCQRIIHQINSAIDLDIPVVLAAGNDGEYVDTVCPARMRRAITVGASDQQNRRADVPATKDADAWVSSHGEKVDIYAPGVEVRGALSGTKNGELVMGGTSMAAPHVSGVVASLLSSNFLTPAQVKKNLWKLSAEAGHKGIIIGAKWHESYLLYNGRPE